MGEIITKQEVQRRTPPKDDPRWLEMRRLDAAQREAYAAFQSAKLALQTAEDEQRRYRMKHWLYEDDE